MSDPVHIAALLEGMDQLDEAISDVKDSSVPTGLSPIDREAYHRAVGFLEGTARGLRMLARAIAKEE